MQPLLLEGQRKTRMTGKERCAIFCLGAPSSLMCHFFFLYWSVAAEWIQVLTNDWEHDNHNSPTQTLSNGTLKLFYSNNVISVFHHRPFLYCVWHFVTRCSCFYDSKRWTVWTYELINVVNTAGWGRRGGNAGWTAVSSNAAFLASVHGESICNGPQWQSHRHRGLILFFIEN